MKNLIREIHRRSLWQVLGVYLAASWVALQVVGQLAQSVGLPAWVEPFAVVLLVIGLPIVLATAVVQEGVPSAGGSGPAASSPEPTVTDSGTVIPAKPATEAVPAGAHQRLFTWRNAAVGGVLAFTLLAALTALFLTMRNQGVGPVGSLVAKGVLDERAQLVLADFDSRDENLAATATEAFRIDLSQSDIVRVVEPSVIAPALERMELEPGTPLDEDLARQLAIREGYPAVISGDINAAGGTFVVSAQLLNAEDGVVLVSHRETASDSTEIVPAIDRLSSKLRERIGESYVSLRASQPLEQVTTGSLEALELYTLALAAEDEGDVDRALGFLEEAVQVDTAFAMAYRKIGVMHSNRNTDAARADETKRLAYQYRDRLTPRERYLTEGTYYMDIEYDIDRAIGAYEKILDRDPEDSWALNNTAVLYGAINEEEKALDLYMASVEAEENVLSMRNAINTLPSLGRIDEAWAMMERAWEVAPEAPENAESQGDLHLLEGDYDAALEQYDRMESLGGASAYWRMMGETTRGRVRQLQGRFEEADELYGSGLAILEDSEAAGLYLFYSTRMAYSDLFTLADTVGAIARIEAAVEKYPLESMPPAERPHLELALFYAFAGDTDRANELVAAREEAGADWAGGIWQPAYLYGIEGANLAFAGDMEAANRVLRDGERSPCYECMTVWRALLWERASVADSAIAAFEAYLEQPYNIRTYIDPFWLGAVYEKMARLYEETGDLENAAVYNAKLVELWAEADPELQPRVEAAQARLEEIVRARG